MSTSIGGQTINVNDDVETFINKMGEIMQGVSGGIYFYDPADFDCNIVIEEITNGVSIDHFAIIGNTSSDRSPPSFDDFTYKVTVIGTIDENQVSELHIRIIEPKEEIPNGKTVYLQCLDGCELNMLVVETTVENFFSLLGDYKKPGENGLPDQLIPLEPNVEQSGYLQIPEVKDNTVIVFGEVSKIIEAAQNHYALIAPEWAHNTDNSKHSICRFYSGDYKSLLEMGHPFINNKVGRIGLVRKDLENYISLYNSSSKEHLSAFLAFHACGHNSGIDHEETLSPTFKSPIQSYMSSACYIVNYYFRKNYIGCGDEAQPGPILYVSLEELVQKTMLLPEFNKTIKQRIYGRFIL